MLADFIPESLALGALFLVHQESAILLTLLIAFQNLPEGFNAFIEVKKTSPLNSKHVISLFLYSRCLGLFLLLLAIIGSAMPQQLLLGLCLLLLEVFYILYFKTSPQKYHLRITGHHH